MWTMINNLSFVYMLILLKLETKVQAVDNNGVIHHLAWPLLVHAPSEASFQRPVVVAAVVADVDVVAVQLGPEKN